LTPAHTVKVLSGLAKHCHKTAEEFAATGDCNKVEFYYKKHHFKWYVLCLFALYSSH